jgi:hypothetical protein
MDILPQSGKHANHSFSYDQESHLAIFQMDVTDASVTRDEDDTPPPWQPLETVLSAWIEMIEIGKILPAEEVVNLENEKMDPWLWYSYSEKQVQATVTAFNKLVTAIESRMPLQNTPGSQSILARSEDSLISTSVLDSASVPESCFVRSFLTSARKPDFKYIAPGLLLPSDSSFEQPLTTVLNEDEDSLPIPPVLLFRADTPKTYSLEPNDSEANPFCEPYNRPDDDDSTKELPAGLYTESIDRKLYDNTEDGFRLLLPYVLGSNGYVRKSDSARFEDGAGLYQHGYQPFGGDPWRAQRLVKLFENWRGMVARGDWGVDENGVMGGIDTFKEADTETGWRKYWIESSW